MHPLTKPRGCAVWSASGLGAGGPLIVEDQELPLAVLISRASSDLLRPVPLVCRNVPFKGIS